MLIFEIFNLHVISDIIYHYLLTLIVQLFDIYIFYTYNFV